jgi:plastocyanin
LRSPFVRRGALSLPFAMALLLGACTAGSSPSTAPGSAGAPDTSDCAQVTDGVITITAEELEFDVPCMVANAGEAFTIHLVNNDTVPHDVAVYQEEAKTNEIMRDEPVEQGEMDYEVPAQEAGEYYFLCTIHPTMDGTLYVVEA